MYPGRELNPHRYYYPQDFKSCVSTNSTTRAGVILKNKKCEANLTLFAPINHQ
jgi:hypothetical protein